MKQREITFISITESLRFYAHYPVGHAERLQIFREACIQERTGLHMSLRLYSSISEASILRLAKIQEKLAQ